MHFNGGDAPAGNGVQESISGTRSSIKRFTIVLGVSILLVATTRLPLMPRHLYSFDSVNLALTLEEFNPVGHQPQPPGYPLFVLEARMLYKFLGTAERKFAVLKILISALSIACLYLLGRRVLSAWIGLIAAALCFVNPVLWVRLFEWVDFHVLRRTHSALMRELGVDPKLVATSKRIRS